MDKNLLKKIVNNFPNIELEDKLDFITQYVKDCKDVDLSVNQLMAIDNMCKMGIFDLGYAIQKASEDNNLTVITVVKNGNPIKKLIQE